MSLFQTQTLATAQAQCDAAGEKLKDILADPKKSLEACYYGSDLEGERCG